MFYRRFGFRRLHRAGREVDVDIWGFLACLSISIIRLHETLYPPFVEAELSFSSFSLPQISVVWALEQSRKGLAGHGVQTIAMHSLGSMGVMSLKTGISGWSG